MDRPWVADTDFLHWSKFPPFRELHAEVVRHGGRCPCESLHLSALLTRLGLGRVMGGTEGCVQPGRAPAFGFACEGMQAALATDACHVCLLLTAVVALLRECVVLVTQAPCSRTARPPSPPARRSAGLALPRVHALEGAVLPDWLGVPPHNRWLLLPGLQPVSSRARSWQCGWPEP